MLGNRFTKFFEQPKSTFDTLFELLQEMLVYTSGDLSEALDWLNELDKKYKITTPESYYNIPSSKKIIQNVNTHKLMCFE